MRKDKIAFWDVDTQVDFMSSIGALYVPFAEDIIGNIATLTYFARKNKIPILGSVDEHEKDDPEFKKFPPHCIKGTLGQKKVITPLSKERYFTKNTFDIFTNKSAEKAIIKTASTYVVYGVATDYCVRAVVLGMLKRGKKVYLVEDAIRGVSDVDAYGAVDLMVISGAKSTGVDKIMDLLEHI